MKDEVVLGTPGEPGDPPGPDGSGGHGGKGGTGGQGIQGERGPAGKTAVTRDALIAVFLFLLLCMVAISLFFAAGLREIRFTENELKQAQLQIKENTERIEAGIRQDRLGRYKGCLESVKIIEVFNKQQRTLAEIEETQTIDRRLAQDRIKAYRNGIQPVPVCGPEPR